jgi:hypothetical protein
MQFTIELGDVYHIGRRTDAPEFGDIHVVVCASPNESLLKTGKLFVAPAYNGMPTQSFHAPLWGSHYINCIACYPVDAVQLRNFEYVEKLSEEQIDSLQDAMSYAEKHRKLDL